MLVEILDEVCDWVVEYSKVIFAIIALSLTLYFFGNVPIRLLGTATKIILLLFAVIVFWWLLSSIDSNDDSRHGLFIWLDEVHGFIAVLMLGILMWNIYDKVPITHISFIVNIGSFFSIIVIGRIFTRNY